MVYDLWFVVYGLGFGVTCSAKSGLATTIAPLFTAGITWDLGNLMIWGLGFGVWGFIFNFSFGVLR